MLKLANILAIGMLFVFCGFSADKILDRGGSNYKTVKIGNQVWMAENLNVGKFRNGDLIPEVKTNEKWMKAGDEGKPAWCYYNNDPAYGKKYGKLYNWYAANDKRGLAPKGWHIPSLAEYQSMGAVFSFEGNTLKVRGEGVGSGVGTNTSGFSALFGGYHDFTSGFWGWGKNASFWTSTQYDKTTAIIMSLSSNNVEVKHTNKDKNFGFSVRCVKN